ncbi:GNAT family N-acetyltransferase [Chelatococcus sp. SYSU_G07232]|uniref:GNAT family N-acetyltransferase n=1 Tax=Chelatococcus albus TaxID=3047466 RepID=A0ABT7AC17_9HYPH|nr:GNAT family N-acetyltransferase [Chelatococcus sp. SYSU_G07232]MDJ1156912.1 GNAT family N-acetyltransferase [Chelatococcus sp. SYSU_G07232]
MWRRLEASGAASPYQRYDWVKSFGDTLGRIDGARTVAVVVSDRDGRPAVLFPLTVYRRGGLRIAQIAGGKHANFHLPLVASHLIPPLNEPALVAQLRGVARAVGGVDAFSFINQPRSWEGEPSALMALDNQPSPSNAYRLTLGPCSETVLRRVLSGETRKKLRRKERRLLELGPVAYRRATTPVEIGAILDAFFAQKADRFKQMGLSNPFAAEAAETFIRTACRSGLEAGRPAIELHALFLGERPIATFGGATDGRRLSGMFTSFDADPRIVRSSPGELLIQRTIENLCERGFATFDLGVGEARYKTMFCDGVEELVDAHVAMTPAGHLYVAAAATGRRLKGWIKQTPWASRLARRVTAAC